MVGGFWLNQDGLPLQFGTQKPIPAVGGDYIVYGETREIEHLIPLITMHTGAGIPVGLATQTTGPNAAFVQVTPQPGTQLLNAFLNARFTTAGQKTSFVVPGATTGLAWDASGTAVAGSNATWLGNVPLVTNAITPLPTSAWISVIQNGGTYTNGLLKLRLRYTMYGNIQQ